MVVTGVIVVSGVWVVGVGVLLGVGVQFGVVGVGVLSGGVFSDWW
jgi:hypothetical protein